MHISVREDACSRMQFLLFSLHRKDLLKLLSRKGYKSVFASFDLNYLKHVFIYCSLAYGMSITYESVPLPDTELPRLYFLRVQFLTSETFHLPPHKSILHRNSRRGHLLPPHHAQLMPSAQYFSTQMSSTASGRSLQADTRQESFLLRNVPGCHCQLHM